jgi:hypothetical protein
MLKLTEKQLEAFAPQLRRQFEEQCVALLRERYAEIASAYPHDKLLEFVRFGIERAQRHGIVAYPEVERWLHLMMRLGPRFDEDGRYAEVATVLGNPDLTDQARLDAVERAVAAAEAGKK